MPFVDHSSARIHYATSGEGPPVLFLQGVGVEGRAWGPQVRDLARDHRCIVIDNRGIGRSEPGDSGLSVDLMARDALAVLDALSVPRAHVVGHSLGGVIASHLACLAKERVASLALLCTFAGGRDLRVPSPRLAWYGTWTRLGTRAGRARAFARLVLSDAYLDAHGETAAIAMLEAAFGRSLADPPSIADRQLAALRAHDERARLGELASIPTYVASGSLDPIARVEVGRALARAIPSASFEAFDDASHALPIQCAEAVNARLRHHVARASRGARLAR